MTMTDRLAPVAEHSKFWQNAHLYFDRVYQTMNLDATWRSVLSAPKRVLAVWRAPERLGRALGWHEAAVDLIDIQVFGETGLIPAARAADGRPAAIRVGPIRVPRSAREPTVIGEAAATTGGTLALRGPMVPGYAFPRWAERGAQPYFNIAPNGFADTGYPCRIDDDATIAVTAPPPAPPTAGQPQSGSVRSACRGARGSRP